MSVIKIQRKQAESAIKFERTNFDEVVAFTAGKAHSFKTERHIDGIAICTIDVNEEHGYIAKEGDYIIKQDDGQIIVVNPQFFYDHYQVVEAGTGVNIKLRIIDSFRDGGTLACVEPGNERINYYIDRRIGTLTKDKLFDKYPGDEGANMLYMDYTLISE